MRSIDPEEAPRDPAAGRRDLPAILVLAVPLALGYVLSFRERPEVGSLAAQLLGPWAGNAFGHSDCTMASVLPGWSAATALLGGAVIAGLFSVRRGAGRVFMLVLGALWSTAWNLLALLSVVNSTS